MLTKQFNVMMGGNMTPKNQNHQKRTKRNDQKINHRKMKSKHNDHVNNESKYVDALKHLMREHFSKMGLNPVIGDIYTECILANKPLSFKELSERTKYSEATISLVLKAFSSNGDLKVFKLPGSKRKYVKVERYNLLKEIENKLKYLMDEFFPKLLFLLKKINKPHLNKNITQIESLTKILNTLIKDIEKNKPNFMFNQNSEIKDDKISEKIVEVKE